jgi:hypothetical protein
MRKLLLLSTTVAVFFVFAAGAQAKFWGHGGTCFREPADEGHHCYALEIWEMAGYPREYVDGTMLYADTTSMDVKSWEEGDQVNDEVWLIFGENDYIETGQAGGAGGGGCCSMHRFWSYTLHGEQNTVYDWNTPAAFGVYNTYEIYDPCHCASWGIWWNGSNPAYQGTQVAQLGVAHGATFYPAWAKELNNGMEAAANHQPYNVAKTEVAAVVPPNDVWTEWKSGYGVHSYAFASPHQCVKRNPESPHWGNIEVSTCVLEE